MANLGVYRICPVWICSLRYSTSSDKRLLASLWSCVSGVALTLWGSLRTLPVRYLLGSSLAAWDQADQRLGQLLLRLRTDAELPLRVAISQLLNAQVMDLPVLGGNLSGAVVGMALRDLWSDMVGLAKLSERVRPHRVVLVSRLHRARLDEQVKDQLENLLWFLSLAESSYLPSNEKKHLDCCVLKTRITKPRMTKPRNVRRSAI